MAGREEKKKVLVLVIPSFKAGGLERVATTVANYFARDGGYNVTIVTLMPSTPFFALNAGVDVLCAGSETSKGTLSKARRLFALRAALKKKQPAAVISFGSMYNSFVIASLLFTNIPIYISDRSNPYRNTRLVFKGSALERHDGFFHYVMRRYLYPRANGLLAQTKLAIGIENGIRRRPKRIIYFPNPIKRPKQISKVDKENLIVNVGRFIPTKNQVELVEIFATVSAPGWRLCLIGDGPELQRVRCRAEELQVADRVIFCGAVQDIQSWLARAKIFAFTSLSEGFPNALAEAMAHGLACVSYDCVAGPSDLIDDSENGYLVPPKDRAGFSEKLKSLMNDEDCRTKIAREARRVADRFAVEKVMSQLQRELFD